MDIIRFHNNIPCRKGIEILGDDCPVSVNGSIETAEDAWKLKQEIGVFGAMDWSSRNTKSMDFPPNP